MARLSHKNKVILRNASHLKGVIGISIGLMFASEEKIKKGVILEMPDFLGKNYKYGVTMLFVFHPLDIIFIDREFRVQDKITLEPWRYSYRPKGKGVKYIIETNKGGFDSIKIGERVELSF